MKYIVPLLGKTREKFIDAGIRDYAVRLRRFASLELPVLKEKHTRKEAEEVVKLNDGALLLAKIQCRGFRVALDPTGTALDSEGLADLITGWENGGINLVYFLIGGHLGLHDTVLAEADVILSLSRLTFTHEMTRLILLEQLYRAHTIKAGHNYHK